MTRPGRPYDVVVIGGSQAGLAMGYHLAQKGLSFVILDAGPEIGHLVALEVGIARVVHSRQYSGLPGMAFPAPEDTYPSRDDVVSYLQAYAATFDLPVRLNSRVTSLTKGDNGYVVATSEETWEARQVVVATGPFQVAFTPAVSAEFDESVFQIHSADYRNLAQIPEGRVLVVGGGNSGFQIAEELTATRKVDLAVGQADALSAAAPSRQGHLLVADQSRLHESRRGVATRASFVPARRSYRLKPQEDPTCGSDDEGSAISSRGSSRCLC